MLIDAPGYKPTKESDLPKENKGITMDKDNAKDIIAMMNGAIMGK